MSILTEFTLYGKVSSSGLGSCRDKRIGCLLVILWLVLARLSAKDECLGTYANEQGCEV